MLKPTGRCRHARRRSLEVFEHTCRRHAVGSNKRQERGPAQGGSMAGMKPMSSAEEPSRARKTSSTNGLSRRTEPALTTLGRLPGLLDRYCQVSASALSPSWLPAHSRSALSAACSNRCATPASASSWSNRTPVRPSRSPTAPTCSRPAASWARAAPRTCVMTRPCSARILE